MSIQELIANGIPSNFWDNFVNPISEISSEPPHYNSLNISLLNFIKKNHEITLGILEETLVDTCDQFRREIENFFLFYLYEYINLPSEHSIGLPDTRLNQLTKTAIAHVLDHVKTLNVFSQETWELIYSSIIATSNAIDYMMMVRVTSSNNFRVSQAELVTQSPIQNIQRRGGITNLVAVPVQVPDPVPVLTFTVADMLRSVSESDESESDESDEDETELSSQSQSRVLDLSDETIQEYQNKCSEIIKNNAEEYTNPHSLNLEPEFEDFLNDNYGATLDNIRCIICQELVTNMYYFPCPHQHKLCPQCYDRTLHYCGNRTHEHSSDCYPSSIKCAECRFNVNVTPRNKPLETLHPDRRFNKLVEDWLNTMRIIYYEKNGMNIDSELSKRMIKVTKIIRDAEDEMHLAHTMASRVRNHEIKLKKKIDKVNKQNGIILERIRNQDEHIKSRLNQLQVFQDKLNVQTEILVSLVEKRTVGLYGSLEKRCIFDTTLEDYVLQKGTVEMLVPPETTETTETEN